MPDSNYSQTRDAIIRRALRRLGKTEPSTQEIADAVEAFNVVIRRKSVEGRWLWTVSNTETSLTLVASTRSYSVASPPTGIQSDIVALERVDLYIGSSYVPLEIVPKSVATSTYYREGTGQPVLVHLERGVLNSANKLHFLPTPNAAYTAKYTYRRAIYDLDNASDNPDFPQEWLDPLTKDLAAELYPEYYTVGPDYHEAKSQEANSKAAAANAEKPVRLPVCSEYF